MRNLWTGKRTTLKTIDAVPQQHDQDYQQQQGHHRRRRRRQHQKRPIGVRLRLTDKQRMGFR